MLRRKKRPELGPFLGDTFPLDVGLSSVCRLTAIAVRDRRTKNP